MYCTLSSKTTELFVSSHEWTSLGDALVISSIHEKVVRLKTGLSDITLNGFHLQQNAEYLLEDSDILIINEMIYTLRFVDKMAPASKKFKMDASPKITEFFNVSSTSMRPLFDRIEGTWNEQRDHLIFTPSSGAASVKIAAFDLDGTLIKTKSGKKYPENGKDWSLLFKVVPKLLREYYEKEYKLVLFTNQLPLGVDRAKRSEFKQKVADILNAIKLPMQVFVATQRTIMRKPCPGMWDCLEEQNEALAIDKNLSFYVGDAAGRTKTVSSSKDHSFADILFARNVNVQFYTPEEFFLNAKAVNVKIPFEPKVLSVGSGFKFKKFDGCEVVLMVGAPASGKSTFCKKFVDYACVSRDELNSWQKCVKVVSDCLEKQQSVVVDNTNKDREARKRFLDVAKRFKVPCRCFYLQVEKMRALHNNKYRELTHSQHAHVSDIIIHSFYKGFEEPQMDEGFDEIVKLDFVPDFESKSEKERELYEMHLLEKY